MLIQVTLIVDGPRWINPDKIQQVYKDETGDERNRTERTWIKFDDGSEVQVTESVPMIVGTILGKLPLAEEV